MFPTRCGIAPESEKSGEEIRQLLYGKRPHVYRILFIVRQDVVYVLHIHTGHGVQCNLKRFSCRPEANKFNFAFFSEPLI